MAKVKQVPINIRAKYLEPLYVPTKLDRFMVNLIIVLCPFSLASAALLVYVFVRDWHH